MIVEDLKHYIDENPLEKFSIIIQSSPSQVSIRKNKITKIVEGKYSIDEMVKAISNEIGKNCEMVILKEAKSVIIDQISRDEIYKLSKLKEVSYICFNKKHML